MSRQRLVRKRAVSVAPASLLAGLLALVGLLLPLGAPAQVSEAELKAQVIDRFTQFIEWPRVALPDAARFVVCIVGESDTADHLATLAGSRRFKARACEVRRRGHAGAGARAEADLAACHLLYIAGSEDAQLPKLLSALADRPVLTISDHDGFAERGVIINLFQEGRYVRFQINLGAVTRSKLSVSSKLLRLARIVKD